MVVSVRKWFGHILFLLTFILLTIMTFGGYRWLIDVISPVDPYREPQGQALKVSGQIHSPEGGTMGDRLRWFYWYGE
ncbi:conserved hypothetical protein [Paenibacillus curdlanolyticus YK9]|uniref:DUF4227 domain-containing protein n=1 Tax=Paenibacillus curdlanolyticus YK9 TaxID=717606 RepID=E0ICG1_9BACL|nr:DUF4227 family protein [Paenibacillus curdlanolyticus]EFM09847.1 conserved hypothetical protein [Paenibacillus curdlanolyticus YK9]